MYYVMDCLSPKTGDKAMLTYKRDHPRRSWTSGLPFSRDTSQPIHKQVPPEPIKAEIKKGYGGIMAEFWQVPVPLMTKRLHKALLDVGVDSLETFSAEIHDPEKQITYDDYVAFNITSKLEAADLKQSELSAGSPQHGPDMDFDSITVDEKKAQGKLLFLLAESVNVILVHEKVKEAIEASGITTLTFFDPKDVAS
jgi:hypothetical protein